MQIPFCAPRTFLNMLSAPLPQPPSPCLLLLRLPPLRSKQIRFGVQTPQEIVKCGVFNVHERILYKVRILNPTRLAPSRPAARAKSAGLGAEVWARC